MMQFLLQSKACTPGMKGKGRQRKELETEERDGRHEGCVQLATAAHFNTHSLKRQTPNTQRFMPE